MPDAPGLEPRVCSAMWQKLTGDCNPCGTTVRVLRDLGAPDLFACPE